jgi:predicted alpha/beta hydrolase family esterase
MKRAVVLHGTSSHPEHNWQPWIKKQLELAGYEVFAPELPGNDKPNQAVYEAFLKDSGWDFNDNLLIGHSSGATAILNLLSSDWLPHIKAAVLVGTFLNEKLLQDVDWYDTKMFKNLFLNTEFDLEKIKRRADHFYFIHGTQDPLCDFEDAQIFCEKLGGVFVPVEGAGHFSSPTSELPEIVTTLKQYNDL